ncbi:MAG: tRNA dihydrouridine synthase DusB [Vampirovibrionia bacterium]
MSNKDILKVGNVSINSRVIAAPLAGVSDVVFRSIIRRYNTDSLVVTEMISSEAIQQNRAQRILDTCETDRPIAYQISGHKPEMMLKAALIVAEHADIIDINMGCPTPKIVKNGDGCGLMRTPELAGDLVKYIVDNIDKPVTVKFRLGWDNNSINCVDIAKRMEDSGASLITVHGRTRSQMYAGKAKWKKIALVKEAVSIPVIANGDVVSPETAQECLDITGCDGVAVGRGLLGDPWLLHRIDHYLKTGELLPEPTIIERLDMAIDHCKNLIDFLGEHHGICHSRKFFGWYIKYVQGAPKYRDQLMRIVKFEDIVAVISEIKDNIEVDMVEKV